MTLPIFEGKLYIQLVKSTPGRKSNFTDLVKKHYVIKTYPNRKFKCIVVWNV